MRSWSTNSRLQTISSRRRCFMLDALAPDDRTWTKASHLAAEVTAGGISALELVEATLVRIRARDPLLNSFTALTEERAHNRARALDEARASGKPLGPLAGVPFAVKNLFDIAGLPTIAGSKINREKEPAPRDAAVIERLEHAGAVLVGALNMGEYAYDFTGENIHDGPSHNPHDLKRMTGGSSGGCGGGRLGTARARLRYQRLYSRAIVMLRDFWTEADIWSAQPGAKLSIRGEPRSRRADGAKRGGSGACL